MRPAAVGVHRGLRRRSWRFSLPGATVATLTGGFLFGLFPGALFNVTGPRIGAIAHLPCRARGLWRATGSADGSGRRGASSGSSAGLDENEWSVLFLMRLVPAVPFFLANLIPARAWRAASAALPSPPSSASSRAGSSSLRSARAWARSSRGARRPTLASSSSRRSFGPILGLAALAALPIVIRRLRRGRSSEHGDAIDDGFCVIGARARAGCRSRPGRCRWARASC